MKLDQRFYVYILYDHDRVPIYVGKGSGGRLFQQLVNCSNEGARCAIAQARVFLGRDPNYRIKFFWSELRAYLHERELILRFGRRNLGTGTLFNLTDGGDGARWDKRSHGVRLFAWAKPKPKRSRWAGPTLNQRRALLKQDRIAQENMKKLREEAQSCATIAFDCD